MINKGEEKLTKYFQTVISNLMECNYSNLINFDWFGKAMFLRLGGWIWQLSSDLNDIKVQPYEYFGQSVSCKGMAGLYVLN